MKSKDLQVNRVIKKLKAEQMRLYKQSKRHGDLMNLYFHGKWEGLEFALGFLMKQQPREDSCK